MRKVARMERAKEPGRQRTAGPATPPRRNAGHLGVDDIERPEERRSSDDTSAARVRGPHDGGGANPGADADTRNDLEVVDETGARFLRYWHFVDGRAIPCLVKLADPTMRAQPEWEMRA